MCLVPPKKLDKLPKRALTDHDIRVFGRAHVPNFRGVFMRDKLPAKPWHREAGVVNLDDSSNPGTHWVAYKKNGNISTFYDSYGDLLPPQELITYLRGSNIRYNYDRQQNFGTYNCGHLCLKFLLEHDSSSE